MFNSVEKKKRKCSMIKFISYVCLKTNSNYTKFAVVYYSTQQIVNVKEMNECD